MIDPALRAKKACTGCGKCQAVCPAGIDIPTVIRALGQQDKIDARFGAIGPEDCIECGACITCCPAKIAVKDIIRKLAMQQYQHDNVRAYESGAK